MPEEITADLSSLHGECRSVMDNRQMAYCADNGSNGFLCKHNPFAFVFTNPLDFLLTQKIVPSGNRGNDFSNNNFERECPAGVTRRSMSYENL